MKKLLSLFLVLLFASSVMAQRIDSASVARLSPELRQEVNTYILEGKKAHTTGMVMAIGGGALALVGVIIVTVEASKSYVGLYDWNTWDNNPATEPIQGSETTANVGAVLFLVGAASALGSIPFFIKVHKKRNAARAILFTDKGMAFTQGITMPGTRSAGISLVMQLER